MTTNSKGLLLVMMEVAPEHEAEFNRWYDQEHVPERMSIPGFLRARRYRALEGGPKYLALYELESPDVLQTDTYKHWTTKGRTEWTERMSQHFRNEKFVRNVYVEILAQDN